MDEKEEEIYEQFHATVEAGKELAKEIWSQIHDKQLLGHDVLIMMSGLVVLLADNFQVSPETIENLIQKYRIYSGAYVKTEYVTVTSKGGEA